MHLLFLLAKKLFQVNFYISLKLEVYPFNEFWKDQNRWKSEESVAKLQSQAPVTAKKFSVWNCHDGRQCPYDQQVLDTFGESLCLIYAAGCCTHPNLFIGRSLWKKTTPPISTNGKPCFGGSLWSFTVFLSWLSAIHIFIDNPYPPSPRHHSLKKKKDFFFKWVTDKKIMWDSNIKPTETSLCRWFSTLVFDIWRISAIILVI